MSTTEQAQEPTVKQVWKGEAAGAVFEVLERRDAEGIEHEIRVIPLPASGEITRQVASYGISWGSNSLENHRHAQNSLKTACEHAAALADAAHRFHEMGWLKPFRPSRPPEPSSVSNYATPTSGTGP